MATVNLEFFAEVGIKEITVLQIPGRSLGSDNLTYDANQAYPAASVPKGTRYVRINGAATLFFAIGASPTATAASARLPADQTEFRPLRQEDGETIACYDGSS